MTATDELRRLLDERGVEWKEHRHAIPDLMVIQRETLWGQPTDVASGKPIPHVYHYRATEMGDGRLFLEAQLVTPEQAIAATLGPQIVRCKDCKHFTHNKEFWIEPPKVPFPMIGATSDCCDFWADTECKVEPDGFCAWGERKVVES